MRIKLTTWNGEERRAILHREFEDGTLLISYVADCWGEFGFGPQRYRLRRWSSIAPQHYTRLDMI